MGTLKINIIKFHWFSRRKIIYLIDEDTWSVTCGSCEKDMCVDLQELKDSSELREMLKRYGVDSDKLNF